MSTAAVHHGRFAPSPSGPLHFGSVVTAVGSWLAARTAGGRWSVRIEDIDRQRERPGAADAILRGLERLALGWDGEVVYQSTRLEAYRAAMARLRAADAVYACACSRREIGGGLYPGTCRERGLAPAPGRALRLRVPDTDVTVVDELQGRYCQALARDCGDYVLWRADGDPAYHLAVVVDDAWQGITEVVRGADLLDSTPRQVHLQQLLGLPTPRHAHLPIVLDAAGRKLSKQTGDTAVDHSRPSTVLSLALDFLGHPPPADLRPAPPADLLAWACAHWQLTAVPLRSRRAQWQGEPG